MNPVVALAGAGAAVAAWGGASLWMHVLAYLEQALPLDSSAGLPVFRVGAGFFSYREFEVGIEPWLVGIGLGMLVAAAFLAAVIRRPDLG